MTDIAALVADNLHIWTGAIQRKSGAGRGSGKRISLYGIERLRALILDLAVRGKLVPQDVEDEPAPKLLAKIRAIKPAYLEKHGLPKQRAFDGQLENAAFQVPVSWAWTRLGDIAAYLQRGKSPKYSEGSGVFVVSQRCVQWAGLDLDVAKEISRKSLDKYEPYRFLQNGDLLWNSTGTGTIGRVIALDDVNDGLVCDSHVTLVRCPWVNPRYVQFWLASDDVYGRIEDLAAGSTNQIEWTAQLATAQPIPLPPLAEQQRIVVKVDELKALCDALERESADAMAAHQALVEALLATLVNSAYAADLARQWARLESHFDTLFTTDASINALKQTILDLAVRGKLVEQNTGDEDASHVLSRAASAHNRRIGLATRKSKGDFEPSKSRFESTSPGHWTWAYIGDFAQVKGGKRIPKGKGFSTQITDHVYIRVTDMEHGTVNLKNLVYIDYGVHIGIAQYTINSSDIYVTIAGTIGHVGTVPELLDGQHLTENAAKIVFSEIDQRFLLLVLNADDVQGQFVNKTQAMAQPKLALKRIAGARVPVPPLAEQRRIVAKVDALMALCDALKARLADAAQTQRHLADAVTERAAA